MEIRVIETESQFLAIRADWDALLLSAETASVFMSWEWNYHWWRHYGREQRLCIITAWIDGQLKGILPIYLQRVVACRICPVLVARFVGTGGDTSPDYLGPVLDPAAGPSTLPALVTCLFDQVTDWQVLELSDLDIDSGFFAELTRQCAARRYRQTTLPTATIAYANLPASWDDYLATLHRDRRNTIRRTRRKLETERQGRFHVLTEEEDVDEALDTLISLHHKRWQDHADGHAFSTPEYTGFHRDVIRACARKGWIRFYCLEADNSPIAMFYCYRFRNQIFYFQAGFDPDYERQRPGLVLIGHAIEHAIGEGNTVFDFLRGEHAYKTQWGKSSRETYTLTAYRPGMRTTFYRLRREKLPALKRRVKRLLRLDRGAGHGTSERVEA